MSLSESDCPICLQALSMQGLALFVAECKHSFHYSCIASSAQAGNDRCPLCRIKWQNPPLTSLAHQSGDTAQEKFEDDEQLDSTSQISQTSSISVMTIAVNGESRFAAVNEQIRFSALVTVKAPSEDQSAPSARVGVDIVAILDVSGSMKGKKIFQLRQTLLAAVDLLGPGDRLSIIKFESTATRLTPLTRMTEQGRQTARNAIQHLNANGGTDITQGLAMAAQIVEGRRSRNPVCGLLLLTDGQDPSAGSTFSASVTRVRAAGATLSSFGFGGDHDSRLLLAIAEAGGGSFTYIAQASAVCETFARCLGGLLSVTAQNVRLHLRSAAGATMAVVAGGGASTSSSAAADSDNDSRWLDLGEMMREESRDLVVELTLPAAAESSEVGDSEQVYLQVEVSWATPGSGQPVVTAEEATAARQTAVAELRVWRLAADELEAAKLVEEADPTAVKARRLLDQHRSRIVAVAALAEASQLADRRDLLAARNVLSEAMSKVQGLDGGAEFKQDLLADLQGALHDIASESSYRSTGHATLRSSRNAHSNQRSYEAHNRSATMYSNSMQTSASITMQNWMEYLDMEAKSKRRKLADGQNFDAGGAAAADGGAAVADGSAVAVCDGGLDVARDARPEQT